MKFIGRKAELEKLNAEYERDGGFVVIYGRRRVGKTTLIKEFLKKKTAFYFLATEELESQSMKRLSGVVARTTKNSYLQNAWDEILKGSNVMLILSGSLIGMMQKHALAYNSPLYGRRTAQMRLAPLSFTDIYAVQKMPFEQAVEQYAVTGGVPKYLEFFEDGRGLEEQLKDAVLSKSGFLYEEPNFLLKSESVTAVNYFSIIKAIADGNHKLGKIAGVLGQETSAMFIPIRVNWNWTICRLFWMILSRLVDTFSLDSPIGGTQRLWRYFLLSRNMILPTRRSFHFAPMEPEVLQAA